MLRTAGMLPKDGPAQRLHEVRGQGRAVIRWHGLPYRRIAKRKRTGIRAHDLDGHHGLFARTRLWVLGRHHVVGILQQIWRHHQDDGSAGRKGIMDGPVEALARHEELVVPDGHVAKGWYLVDARHHLLRMGAVLLAVTEEQRGVEGLPDACRNLVAYQHLVHELVEPLLVGQRRGVGLWRMAVKALQVAADAVERAGKTWLLKYRQHRDVVRQGKGQLHGASAALLVQEARGDGDHEQLHLGEVGKKGLVA